MMRSLYSAISGLSVNQQAMDVLGNNISNVNTIGYKSSRAVFEDLLSQTISGSKAPTDSSGGINAKQVGLGSSLASVDTVFDTGTMQTTGVDTDLAVQGQGFFVVNDGTSTDHLYTRAGDFSFDADGSLTNSAGYYVQGWMADPETGDMVTDTNVDNIELGSDYQTAQAKATTSVSLAGVLDTQADASVLEYPSLLHYADGTDSIFSVYGSDGADMDLSDNESVLVKAHGTGMTDMGDVTNDSDVNLGLSDDPSILMYVNSTAYTFTYGSGVDTATTKYYTDMGDFASQLQSVLNTEAGGADFGVSVNNGTFQVDRTGYTSTDVSIDSVSGSAILAVGLSDLASNYNSVGDTKSSDELYYEGTIYAGRDFNTLNELAGSIESELDGNVVDPNYFSASYDGTTGKMNYTLNPTSSSGTLSLSGFSLDKAYSGTVFEKNIVPSSSSAMTATWPTPTTVTSDTFLRTAQDSDKLTDLFTNNGDSLGLDSTAILQFSASVGGTEIPGSGSLSVSSATVDDLRNMMADHLGYQHATESELSQHLASLDKNSGKLQVTGEKGESNDIDYLKFDVVGSGDYSAFYNYFEYNTIQNASGGQLTTSQTVYDSQGASHTIQYNFSMDNANDNTWKLSVSSPEDGVGITLNEATDNSVLLHFNNDGSFNYLSTTGGTRIADLTMNIDPGTGAGIIPDVAVDLGTASQFDGIYIAQDDSGINTTKQDGYPTGTLESTLFNSSGEIIGYYTNGQISTIAQIALATFTNSDGLLKVGDTTFQATANSGDAAIGQPGTGFRGEVSAGTLENSNVDLSSEFVNMITTQRGFQANSRVITTSDEMLQELLSLKR